MRKTAVASKQSVKQPARAMSATMPIAAASAAGLQEKHSAVQNELTRLRAQLRDWPTPEQDGYDPLLDDYAKNTALVEQYELHLAEIAEAMRAAQHGAYGKCERCGQPIGAERLAIMPETRWCVKCRGQVEREAVHRTLQ